MSHMRSRLRLFPRPSLRCGAGEDIEGRCGNGGFGHGEAGGLEDGFEFTGADDGIDFRNVLYDFVAVALDEAAGDDELAGGAGGFEARHLQDGVDRLLLLGQPREINPTEGAAGAEVLVTFLL